MESNKVKSNESIEAENEKAIEHPDYHTNIKVKSFESGISHYDKPEAKRPFIAVEKPCFTKRESGHVPMGPEDPPTKKLKIESQALLLKQRALHVEISPREEERGGHMNGDGDGDEAGGEAEGEGCDSGQDLEPLFWNPSAKDCADESDENAVILEEVVADNPLGSLLQPLRGPFAG